MSKIEWRNEYNRQGKQVLILEKKRGKLTFQEVQEFLLYEGNGTFNGHYAIYIRATESMCGGSGWLDEEEKGDVIELYLIEDNEDCPICGKVTPIFQYCPECGASLKG